MAISKRLRFEVLKRDGHRCRYCGGSAPDVVITVDHVVPQALGGSDEPSNLVAACKSCNDGKSSSSPDAPLVADVAKDALRWATAMQTAAGEMLARASGDVDARAHFEKAWARYGTGPRRKPLPKDPGWEHTVDTLLSAGLPMAVLEECIEIAMSQRKVAEDNVFRYMCGIAWRKVHELRDRAQELAQGEPAGDGESRDIEDIEDEAVQRWCSLILDQRDPGEVEVATRDCREYSGSEEPPGVLWFVVKNLEHQRAALRDGLRELIRALPGDIGERLIKEQEGHWRDADATLYQASMNAVDHVLLARARQEMALMPRDEYESWVQLAKEENSEIAEHLSDSYYITEAARMAREALIDAQGGA